MPIQRASVYHCFVISVALKGCMMVFSSPGFDQRELHPITKRSPNGVARIGQLVRFVPVGRMGGAAGDKMQ